MSTLYYDAVSDAIQSLKGCVVDGKLDFLPSTFADAVQDFGFGIDMKRNASGDLHYSITEAMGVYLVGFAQKNPQFYDLAVEICRKNLTFGMSLPNALRTFAIENIGENNRPTPRHRERKPNWVEKAFIRVLVLTAVKEFHLVLTRNEATASRISACDAIAEALTASGRKTNYSEIANLMVHKDHAQFRLEVRALEELSALREADGCMQNALSENYSKQTMKVMTKAAMAIKRTFPSAQN